MIKKLLFLSGGLFLSSVHSLNAQTNCPSGITGTITTQNVTCGNNGTLTVDVSNKDNVRLLLFKDGGTAPILEATNLSTTSHTFTTLGTGSYKVRAVCNTDIGVFYFEKSANITSTYVPISKVDISSSISCGDFTPKATIKVGTITGGNPPYTYSFVKSDSPNYLDDPSTYGTSATKDVTEYGTYQVRVKDACGNFFTSTIQVATSMPPARVEFSTSEDTCGITTAKFLRVRNHASGAILSNNFSATYPKGLKMIIRKGAADGEIIFDGTYTGQDLSLKTPDTGNGTKPPVYYITTMNECGVEASYNVFQYDGQEQISVTSTTSGCGTDEKLKLAITPSAGMVLPVTVKIKDANGITVATGEITTKTSNGNRSSIELTVPIGAYTIEAVDACGIAVNNKVDNPKTSGESPILEVRNYDNSWCSNLLDPLTVTGATQVMVHLKSGYIPGADQATAVIKSGPSNVGVAGVGRSRWQWSNMLPGDYIITVTSCGIEQDLPLTVSSTQSTILKQSVTSVASTVCQGGGSISSKLTYNGKYANSVELLNERGDVLQSNASGNFINLPAGTYTTRLKISVTTCSDITKNFTYYIPGSTVTITGASDGPKVQGQALLCETGSDSTPTGTAYLNIQGAAPYTIRYKLNTESQWITAYNKANESDYVITGLEPHKIYSIEVADACGKSSVGDYLVGTISDNFIANTKQPCNNKPYTLEGSYFPGATYRWLNPNGAVVSTQKDYYIPSFNNTFNGKYTLETRWGDCLIRTTELEINSALCDNPISQNHIEGNVFHDTTDNNQVDGIGIGIASATQLYISVVMANELGEPSSTIIKTVKVNANGTYRIPNMPQGNYALILHTNPSGSHTPSLPSYWINTGESIPSNVVGQAGNADGIIFVVQQSTNSITKANFGINKSHCYKPANVTGTALDTKFGITALSRAGNSAEGKNWPMLRKGAHAVLEANTKGFVLNRVKTSDITNPTKGMLVYDKEKDCLSLYDGTTWKCLKQPGCPD